MNELESLLFEINQVAPVGGQVESVEVDLSGDVGSVQMSEVDQPSAELSFEDEETVLREFPHAFDVALECPDPEPEAVPLAVASGSIQSGYFPSGTSNYAVYVKGFLCRHPFCDYAFYQSGSSSYRLIWGYKLSQGAECNTLDIDYVSGVNGYYRVSEGASVVPSLPLCYSNFQSGSPLFYEVEVIKYASLLAIGAVCALAFSVLCRVFFR